MPIQRLAYSSGVDTERSATTMRGGYVSSNLINFREGLPEKVAGWQRISGTKLLGVCRALHYWSDLVSNKFIAAGTERNLYVENIGIIHDITPAGWPSGAASSGNVPYSLLIWSLDNFGQNLIAIPSGGGVYQWVPDIAFPPVLIAQAPKVNQGGFVASPQRIIMAYGCSNGATAVGDPLLIRWCDQEDPTDWTASPVNQAGSFRLSRGSRITGGLSCNLGQFLWTDLDVWGVQYLGFPAVFGFNILAANSGLLAQKAVTAVGNTIYWMSDHGFFVLSGSGVQPIPCTVWDKVYLNLDTGNQDKCLAGADQVHNQVWFFYPSKNGGSGEIDSYVKYNYMENLWDFGPATPQQANLMARTAWTDQNQPGSPVNVDLNSLMQQNDVGVDADGAAMTGVMFQTGYQDLADGQDILFVDQLIPDWVWLLSTSPTPSLEMSLYFRNWPGDTPTVAGPYTVTPTTQYITLRTRARELSIAVRCDGLGSWFRMGTNRLRAARDGRI